MKKQRRKAVDRKIKTSYNKSTVLKKPVFFMSKNLSKMVEPYDRTPLTSA